MTLRPKETAETDEVATEFVPAAFARKMERERDEAIAERKASAADWLNQIEQANARVSRALQQVALAERDRDEARAAIRAALAEKWLLNPQCAEDQAIVDSLWEAAK